MSTEPAGGTISGNSTDTNTITDRQLFDHAISSPDPTPAPDTSQPSSSPPSSTQPQGAQASERPASTRPDLQQGAQTPGQPRDPQGKFAPKPQGQELTRAVMDLQQRLSPQQPQQPQGPETIFDDPREYLDQHVMQPLRQEG